MDSSTYGNGVVTDSTYRNDNMVATISFNDATQTLIDSFSYSYDANKNVTGETRGGVMSGFSWNTNNSGSAGYDDDDRLTYWKHADSSQTQSWNLSLVGDWNSTTINGTPQNRTHNSVHELTAVGSTPLTYDVKGNLTANTNGHTYSWDFDNCMSGADTDSNSVDDVLYEYDALGRRVRKNNGTSNTVFVLAGWQVLAEYSSGAVPASPAEQYVYASYIDEPILKTGTGGSVYYSRNRQYSITSLTNSTGAPIEYYAYDSHGKLAIFDGSASPLSASQYANPYTYTARRFEPETDLYYFRARYFDSALGRFIGRDPIGYVDGMSLYRGYFVPLGIDPFGLQEPEGKFIDPFGRPTFGMGAKMYDEAMKGVDRRELPQPGLRNPISFPTRVGIHLLVNKHEIQRRMLDHYAGGAGTPMFLSKSASLEVMGDPTLSFYEEFDALVSRMAELASVDGEPRTETISGLKSKSYARIGQTLGNYYHTFDGSLSVSCDGNWEFDGTVTFSDYYDFNKADRPWKDELKVTLVRNTVSGKPYWVFGHKFQFKENGLGARSMNKEWEGKKRSIPQGPTPDMQVYGYTD